MISQCDQFFREKWVLLSGIKHALTTSSLTESFSKYALFKGVNVLLQNSICVCSRFRACVRVCDLYVTIWLCITLIKHGCCITVKIAVAAIIYNVIIILNSLKLQGPGAGPSTFPGPWA